jgi:hypothetical protein
MVILFENKILKAIFWIILIIGIPLFLANYESIFLACYQQTVTDLWALYILVPLMFISIVIDGIDSFKKYTKSDNVKLWKFLKATLLEFAIIFIVFAIVLKPVVSGTFILINAAIGHQTSEIVDGIIIDRIDYSGRAYEYKLSIKTDSEILIFDTDIHTIVHYHKGDRFNEKMKRGCLGLLYNK